MEPIQYLLHTQSLVLPVARTRLEGDGGRGIVFPAARGLVHHGCFSGVVEEGVNVTIDASKARLLVAVEACTSFESCVNGICIA